MKTIADIESYLWDIIVEEEVCSDVYVGNAPLTITDNIGSYIIVSAPSPLYDYTEYGRGERRKGNIMFEVFAKDRIEGEQNSYTLCQMENNLIIAISNKISTEYRLKYKTAYSSPYFNGGWHSKILLYELTIL